jgi:hypothetical protein
MSLPLSAAARAALPVFRKCRMAMNSNPTTTIPAKMIKVL